MIHRLDPRLDALIEPGAETVELAAGFGWTEGPVWDRREQALLFSDVARNTLYRWKEGEGLAVYLRPASAFLAPPLTEQCGSNGLAFDAQGRLVLCEHGNRCISRLDGEHFTRTVLADRFEGKRLNSPNDLVFHSGGDLYFSDPCYGLPGREESPYREQPVSGVYRLTPAGELSRVIDEMACPNGLALSPDEKTLYVSQSGPFPAIWRAYPVLADGTLGEGRLFHDADAEKRGNRAGLNGSPDGMAVDRQGNLFAAGPGGLRVIAPDGALLGVVETGERCANCVFGDDGSTLYLTWGHTLRLLRLRTQGT